MNNNAIIFVHRGNQDYFKTVLKQAKKTNPQSKIVVIGDTYDKEIKGIDFYNIDNFKNSFSKIYKHYSTNDYKYELICFERWFIIKDFMVNNNIDFVFASDSDLMIYDNLFSDISVYNKYIAGFCILNNQENFRWLAPAHISFWTREGIIKFCNFIEEYYTTNKIETLLQKWNYHTTNNVPGGVCDMTLLYLFYIENKDHIKNLLIVEKDSVFDNNINFSENYYEKEYDFDSTINIKNIKFLKKKPYCKNLLLNKNIYFKVLHFQGGAKQLINAFYYTSILDTIPKKIYIFMIKIKNKLKSLLKLIFFSKK